MPLKRCFCGLTGKVGFIPILQGSNQGDLGFASYFPVLGYKNPRLQAIALL